MSNRLYSAAISNEVVNRPMKLITNPVVVIAGILLAALMLASTFSVSAQTAVEREYRYAENRTDPVNTFRANPPDVKWTLGGPDAGAFDISKSGVLTFKKTPNFENPDDVAADAVQLSVPDDADFTDPGEAAGIADNNIYRVNILADGTLLVAAIVTVTDVDDPGVITLSHLQPAEGIAYEADAVDQDDGLRVATAGANYNKLWEDGETGAPPALVGDPSRTYARWKWEKSLSGTSGWADIPKQTGASYTPTAEDVGYYLRVTATYSDRDLHSGGDDNGTGDAAINRAYAKNAPIRTARKVSEYPVKAQNDTNQPPVFPDDVADVTGTATTLGKQQLREVDENDKNAVVGAPVTASDPGDVLQYTWANFATITSGPFAAVTEDDRSRTTTKAGAFKLDRMTGQITVNGSLNFEEAAALDATPGQREVYVTATDAFGSSATVEVRITVNDVNDAPELDKTDAGADVADSDKGATAATASEDPDARAFTATTGRLIYEAYDEDMVDADNDPDTAATPETVTLSLAGPDAKYFEDSDGTPGGRTLTLAFKSTTVLNFEEKKTYKVTVVARDSRGKTDEQDVTVTITNAEDLGKIKLSTLQPQVGIPITATLTDEDGVQGSITWQWGTAAPGGTYATGYTCPSTGYSPITGGTEGRGTKQTFTPTADDVGGAAFAATCIGVTATYADGFPAVVPPALPTNNADLIQEAANPVLPARTANRAPQFKENGKVVSSTTRSVKETAKEDAPVGKAVEATDPDDGAEYGTADVMLDDKPTYSLHGTDAATFKISRGTGQISVKGKLDYETKQTHNVVVRATDGRGASANISVTITVTDENEAPKVSGDAEVTYVENGTVNVGTYTADDPENDAVTWSLKPISEEDAGQDAGKFRIDPDTGVLTFKSPPNFEATGTDADADGNNVYEVTVVATDTVDNPGEKDVEVTVTNTDDAGKIGFDVVQPGVGVKVTADAKDEDKSDKISAATYQWMIGDSADGPFTDIENATKESYTPVSDDAGKYLQLTAEYGAKANRKSISGGFDHPVAGVDVANPVPVFPDQNLVTEAKETAQEREVPENSKRGTLVGDPVTASDDDVLTYTVHDGHGASKQPAKSKKFTIDQATGQIKVGNADLDYEDSDANLHEVTVTATDANAASADVEVTIIVTDVDEKPNLRTPVGGAIDNIFAAPEKQTVIDADDTVVEVADTTSTDHQAATYTATDDDAGDAVTWSVEGADADKFKITATSATDDGVTTYSGTLAFEKAPDYEAEASAAGSNRYKVTIVASDRAGNRSTKKATVIVTNVNEDGTIELSTVQPQVGKSITATLKDPDGVVGTARWTWTVGGTAVEGEIKDTFTPATGATGELTVAVCYNDTLSGDGSCTIPGITTVQRITQAPGTTEDNVSRTYGIRAFQASNFRPEFQDEEDKKITSTTREIRENTAEGINVGLRVDAVDKDTGTPNGLTYTLSGPDAASFTIDRGAPATNGITAVTATGGQIKTKAKLDYETKNVYTVIVTATDGSGAAASITVTINITDQENEPPELLETPPNNEPEFAEATYELEVVEGMTTGRDVGTVAATDEDEDDTLSYELSGDDADSFTITSNGQIRTNAALVADTKDEYTVTVTVDDGNEGTASAEVTITVTAAPAPVFGEGESASRSVAENSAAGTNVGDPVTASVTLGDIEYALGGDDAASFAIDDETGQITVGEGTALDFEATSSYSVSVTATNDTGGESSIEVTISVENVNEPGTLSVSADAPEFGEEVTASVSDPDGGITDVSWEWQWSELGLEDTWTAIPGGRGASYTPAESDGGLLIRVEVTYTDASGEESTLESGAIGVPPAPEPPAPEPTPTPVPPAPTPTPVPPAPTATPVPPTATPVPPTATPVPPTATPVPPAPTATPVPEDEGGGFPVWLIIVIVLLLGGAIAAGVLVVRYRQQQ